ncbi:kinesin-like protein KIN-8A isoform X2 [Phoenix dactylifera]|uniref:Kinesin-like protein n=1 Tax=Phoenix dactylifera TaxID=42345 RepID=A0A8B7CLU5_PHODC|nr:kinesin-like protein KIN-8A isoform X2 [Phoenix dactylifera]
MPVSTRSQISVSRDETISADHRSRQPPPPPSNQEPPLHPAHGSALLRNPHHGLKEKMRALTLFYEQHKQQLASSKDHSSRSESRVLATHRRSVELVDSNRKKGEEEQEGEEKRKKEADGGVELVMKENIVMPGQPKATTNPIVFPRTDAKENQEVDGGDRVTAYSCPKKPAATTTAAARKLSMGGFGAQSEGRFTRRKAGGELGAISENSQSGSRILVFVRLRPMAKKEKEAGSRCCVKIVNRKEVYLTEFSSETDYLRLKRLRGRHFCFDASFPDSTTQQEVYGTTTADLVEGVLQGRNGSVFCYGATGAGKTYTMLGTVENPGVMVLAIKDLFSKIRQRSYDGNHSVQLSYLEVYNETVRDLLSPGRPLILREDKQGIVAAGLTQYRAYSTDEVMALLQQGNQNRTTEPTRVNETSSRSHAILQVVAEFRVKESGNVASRVGKLSLIDLAGSERALATDQRSQRTIEGANINRSLLALSSCINALVEGKKHIPYRNSKLTQLLKDSLGGSCNTVMIANISPSNLSFGETQNTLHWADRAKEIKTKACNANEEVILVPESETEQAKLLLELHKENSELRQQLVRHQQKLLTIQAQSLAANSSPAPPAVSSPLLSPPCSTQRKVKRSILSGNCFSTPESKKKSTTDDAVVQELKKTVKTLEAEIERLKKEHMLQIKQKDDFIHELINKNGLLPLEEGAKRVVTRASLRKGARAATEGALKSPSHRFVSPVPTAKKRSFWDITTGNSPSVLAAKGRKTRSHVATETPPAPSMLLQPGFTRPRPDPSKR